MRNFLYRSREQFFSDVKLVADNCELYNGQEHPLTLLSKSFLDRVNGFMQGVRDWTLPLYRG